ncbi:hypothetical protein Trydic_g20748 [Trypoxylus dichotomus]
MLTACNIPLKVVKKEPNDRVWVLTRKSTLRYYLLSAELLRRSFISKAPKRIEELHEYCPGIQEPREQALLILKNQQPSNNAKYRFIILKLK